MSARIMTFELIISASIITDLINNLLILNRMQNLKWLKLNLIKTKNLQKQQK